MHSFSYYTKTLWIISISEQDFNFYLCLNYLKVSNVHQNCFWQGAIPTRRITSVLMFIIYGCKGTKIFIIVQYLKMGFWWIPRNEEWKWGRVDMKKGSPCWRTSFFMRCLAESNRSTRFCRPLPNRSVKTPCVEQSFLICECKGTTFYWFYQIFMQLF